MNRAPSRPRSRRIGVLVPEIVHSCYFALIWSTHRLPRRHVADRIFIVLFLRHGNHSERYNRRQQQNLFPRHESILVIRRLRDGVIYKLVEVETGGRIRSTAKFSEAKKTYPGRKQVFRFSSEEGTFSGDVIGLEDERFAAAEPLLVPVMRHGRRLEPALQEAATTARAAQQRFLAARARLPSPVAALGAADPPFPVSHSNRLEELCENLRLSFVKTARC